MEPFTERPFRAYGIYEDGTAACLCRCEAHVIAVPLELIRRGETLPCSDGCRIGGPQRHHYRAKPTGRPRTRPEHVPGGKPGRPRKVRS